MVDQSKILSSINYIFDNKRFLEELINVKWKSKYNQTATLIINKCLWDLVDSGHKWYENFNAQFNILNLSFKIASKNFLLPHSSQFIWLLFAPFSCLFPIFFIISLGLTSLENKFPSFSSLSLSLFLLCPLCSYALQRLQKDRLLKKRKIVYEDFHVFNFFFITHLMQFNAFLRELLRSLCLKIAAGQAWAYLGQSWQQKSK